MASKIIPSRPLLILLYGYPGAGKTYFGRQLCNHLQAAHVHSERIRAELFETPQYDQQENAVVGQLVDYMAEEFLQAGLSVVYDATASRQARRRELREMARKHHAQTVLIWFQIDPDSAYARATKRDKRRQDDRYSLAPTREQFDYAASVMQNPLSTEEYIVVSGKHVFTTQLGSVMKRMHELGLVQANDALAKIVKPGLVNLVPNSKPQYSGGRVDLSRRNIIIR